MSKKLRQKAVLVIALAALAVSAVKLSGPLFLKIYIEQGVGNCKAIPILCMQPRQIDIAAPEKSFIDEMVPFTFSSPAVEIYAPKGFKVVRERMTKVYYKKRSQKYKGDTIYMVYQEKDFFVNLYPQLKRYGIEDDYAFVRRVMYANINTVSTLVDAFFVIIKGIFTPNLGPGSALQMAEFVTPELNGFINYSLYPEENYFDCNVFDKEGRYFKIYIKDKSALLDLKKAFAILSSVRLL